MSCAKKLVHDVSKHYKPKQAHRRARFGKLPVRANPIPVSAPDQFALPGIVTRPGADEMLHRGNQPEEESIVP